jgi:hypothetical protein
MEREKSSRYRKKGDLHLREEREWRLKVDQRKCSKYYCSET